MSFTWFADQPLHTPQQWMGIFIAVADELDMTDRRGAVVCAAMCAFQEAGADPHRTGVRQIWVPGNDADPCFKANPTAYPHDAMGDDGRSTGPFQQQTNAPGETPWGWGGVYGDCAGTRRRMDPVESTRLFLAALKRNGYDAGDAPAANDSIQQVQRSGAPNAYAQWWDLANDLYDRVTGEAVPPTEITPMLWTGDPVWIEDVLRAELGDRLRVLDGWDERGHGDFLDIWGVMVHHTGNSRETAESIRDGRPDLAGPLSNLHIAPDGTVTLVAVGVCWHAGAGSYPGVPTDMGNYHLIGIECAWPDVAQDGSYDPGQRWPDAQIISMRDTCAALATRLHVPAAHVIGHKEYAGVSQGKWDPGNLDMGWFRGEVAKDMAGKFNPKPTVPPTPQPDPAPLTVPPDALARIYDQRCGRWEMLGWNTELEVLAELRDHLLGTTDAGKRGFTRGPRPTLKEN